MSNTADGSIGDRDLADFRILLSTSLASVEKCASDEVTRLEQIIGSLTSDGTPCSDVQSSVMHPNSAQPKKMEGCTGAEWEQLRVLMRNSLECHLESQICLVQDFCAKSLHLGTNCPRNKHERSGISLESIRLPEVPQAHGPLDTEVDQGTLQLMREAEYGCDDALIPEERSNDFNSKFILDKEDSQGTKVEIPISMPADQQHVLPTKAADESPQTQRMCSSSLDGAEDDEGPTLQMLHSHLDKPHKYLVSAASVVDRFLDVKEPPRTSTLSKIVDGLVFEGVSLTIIIVNCIFTIYVTNYQMEKLTLQPTSFMSMAEIVFLSWYTIEMLLKMTVHRLYFFWNIDMKWNLFDLCLVLLGFGDFMMAKFTDSSTLDMTFMRSLRLLKLSKVLRMFRVLRFFHDLRLMIDCVTGSFISLLWCMVILGFFWIIFALLFVQGLSSWVVESKLPVNNSTVSGIRKSFGSVWAAMFSLFKAISGGDDWSQFYDMVEYGGTLNAMLFIFYIIFFIFAACNIVTSIFMEKAMKLAQPDLETLLYEKKTEDLENAKELRRMCSERGGNSGRSKITRISYKEFKNLMSDERIRSYFELKGLAIKDAELFFHIIGCADQEEEVDINDFIAGCMKTKGFALSVDLLSLGYQTKQISNEQKQYFADVREQLKDIHEKLSLSLKGSRGSL